LLKQPTNFFSPSGDPHTRRFIARLHNSRGSYKVST
jgi:hypothetical protein